jgi:hypothetical protein
MLAALRTRLTYANVMASVALFVALGGTGYAVSRPPRNSVGTKQLRKNSVTSPKVRNRSLLRRDFKPGQLAFLTPAGADSRYYTKGQSDGRYYTKGESDGRFLGKGGKAADADKLDNLDSSAFVRGGGTTFARTLVHFSNPLASDVRQLVVPGYGELTMSCEGASYAVSFKNTQSDNVNVWSDGSRDSNLTAPSLEPVERVTVAPQASTPLPSPAAGNDANVDFERTSVHVHVAPDAFLGTHVAELALSLQHARGGGPLSAACRSAISGVLAP